MAKQLVNPRSAYTWDRRALKYRRVSDGRFVSQRSIKQSLNVYVRRTQQEIERLAREVAAGKMPVSEWRRQTAANVKNAHISSQAAARGGWGQLTQRDYGRIGAGLKRQYKHLRGFAKELRRMTPAQIISRAGMYARSAAAAYEQGRFDGFRDIAEEGVTVEMRNRLGQGEHCSEGSGRPGCIEESARGWVDLGELSLPGSRRCLTRCLCEIVYRITDE